MPNHLFKGPVTKRSRTLRDGEWEGVGARHVDLGRRSSPHNSTQPTFEALYVFK